MKSRFALLALLTWAVLTVWVVPRWALSSLEVGAYVLAAAVLSWRAFRGERLTLPAILVPPLFMAAWAALQRAAHWTVSSAATADAEIYWLAAACLILLGWHVSRNPDGLDAFLISALGAGSLICVVGTLQLYTSRGRIFWLFDSGYYDRVIGPFVSPNNFASFVELLLPISLSLALKRKDRALPYLVIAAVLTASVVASASRAGAIMTAAEIVLIFFLRPTAGAGSNIRKFLAFAVLAMALSLIVGQQLLFDRLKEADPFADRREFSQSSLAMFVAQPLRGFGLGAWPAAYPAFAVIDTGLIANHAHNEWAQWGAEGGLPAFAAAFALFIWALRPALRSIWGIGILAVFVHSLVDYPFLRLGLAAWIFALLGALAACESSRRSTLAGASKRSRSPLFGRVIAATAMPVIAGATLVAVTDARADALYRTATLAGVKRAAQLRPDNAEYEVILAQLDPADAIRHLQNAIQAEPLNSKARIALATELEFHGALPQAEHQLLEAARGDRQFAPAWALANFYFRSNRRDKFWDWMRRAAAMSYGDRRALFDLCFLASNDVFEIEGRLIDSAPSLEQPFLRYLLERRRVIDAQQAADRLASHAGPDAREVLLDYVDASIASGAVDNAARVWNRLCARHLLPYGGPSLLANGDFSRPLLNRGFDWRAAGSPGIVTARNGEHNPALEVELSGREPEEAEILSHALALPADDYVLNFEYRTDGLPPTPGIHWSLAGSEFSIDAQDSWTGVKWHFHASGKPETLSLAYRRAPGTTRIEGDFFLRNVRIDVTGL